MKKIQQIKRDERDEQICNIKSTLNLQKEKEYEKILKFSLKQLQDKLFKREILAETVLEACLWKSIKVQNEFNCIAEYISGAMVCKYKSCTFLKLHKFHKLFIV